MQIVGHRVLLAQVIQSQLTEDFINSIAWCIGLNPDVPFRIKVLKDRYLCKRMP